ncbi:MAG: hypothetical protein AAF206_11790 [Bacteroidota bacterium]
MAKRLLLFCILLVLSSLLMAQDSLLLEINTHRLQISKTSMYVLGGWSVGNMALSGFLRSQTNGTKRYFHEMNVFWNVVNLGFAGAGLYGIARSDPAALGLWETFHEQQKLEKILLFNVALNISYMVGGGWLIERSKTALNRPERLKGYGQSLILQGAFLFLFDTTQVIIQQSTNAPKLQQLLSHAYPIPGGIGFSFQF